MTIPVSTIVKVDIRLDERRFTREGFGILNLVTNQTGVISQAERIRQYDNIDDIIDDWTRDSEVFEGADAYFRQRPSPDFIKISVRFEEDQSAQLRGGGVVDNADTVIAFVGITNGSFVISIDGDSQDLQGMDFSSVTDTAAIASVVQATLQAVATGGYSTATCIYKDNRFFIDSGTVGTSSTILFATVSASGTDVSSLLQLRQAEATKTNGIEGETISKSLDAISDVDSDYYGLAFTKEMRDGLDVNGENGTDAAGDWVETRTRIFFNNTNDIDAFDSVTTNDELSNQQKENRRQTTTIYSSFVDEYPNTSLAGRAFTTNFNVEKSSITLKFKDLPGITPEEVKSSQVNVIDDKFGNIFVVIGGKRMYKESFMADGLFIDEVHGVDWLTEDIRTNVFNVLHSSPKVPYTDSGTAQLEQGLINSLEKARSNGLIAPGFTSEGVYLPLGYETFTTPVAESDQTEKENRQYTGVSFVALLSLAIHSAELQGRLLR